MTTAVGEGFFSPLENNIDDNLRISPQCHSPPENWALIRSYWGMMVVDNPLIRPYLLGGKALGGTGDNYLELQSQQFFVFE